MSTLGGAQQVSIFFGRVLKRLGLLFMVTPCNYACNFLCPLLPSPPGQSLLTPIPRCFFRGCSLQLRLQLSVFVSINCLKQTKTSVKQPTKHVRRRNLSSSHWAAIAVEAEEILAAIAEAVEQERLEKQKANAANQHVEALVNKLTEGKSKNYNETKTAHKAAELVLTSRKTGWLTSRTFASFSPCTKPTTLHVVFDIFYSTICSGLEIRFCRVTDTSLTVTLLKSATKLPGRG